MKINYEYFIQNQSTDLSLKEGGDQLEMNSMGALGWELCEVIIDPAKPNTGVFIYKRALPLSLNYKMGTVETIYFIGDDDHRISFVRGMIEKYKDVPVRKKELFQYLSNLVGMEEVSEETFWSVVEQLQWNSDTDYNKHRVTLSKQFNGDQIMSLGYNAKMFRKRVQTKLNQYAAKKGKTTHIFCKGADDSWWDFCAHIVGSGKDFYEKALKDPESVLKMKYKENFEYCFHSLEKKKEQASPKTESETD